MKALDRWLGRGNQILVGLLVIQVVVAARPVGTAVKMAGPQPDPVCP